MMHYWNNGWDAGGAVWMSVMMLVFWGAVAWVLVAALRRSRADQTKISAQPDASLAAGPNSVDRLHGD